MEKNDSKKFIVDEKGILHKIDEKKVKADSKFINITTLIDLIAILVGFSFVAYGIYKLHAIDDSTLSAGLFIFYSLIIGFPIWLIGMIIYFFLRKDQNWKSYLRKSLLLGILNYLAIIQIIIFGLWALWPYLIF